MGNSFIYLVWIILNIIACWSLIYLFFYYTKLIYKRTNTFVAIIFILLIFNFLNGISPSKLTNNNTIILNNSLPNAYNPIYKHYILEENTFSKMDISLKYQFDTTQVNTIPLYVYTSHTGFISGVKWIQNDIQINKLSNQTYHYSVSGYYNWDILGFNILTFHKYYTGDLTIEPFGR